MSDGITFFFMIELRMGKMKKLDAGHILVSDKYKSSVKEPIFAGRHISSTGIMPPEETHSVVKEFRTLQTMQYIVT
jgi:hypothetical protein